MKLERSDIEHIDIVLLEPDGWIRDVYMKHEIPKKFCSKVAIILESESYPISKCNECRDKCMMVVSMTNTGIY